MRKRYYLSLNMDDPRHRAAEVLIAEQSSRKRTEYIVVSVLAADQANLLEQLVRRAVRDELDGLRFSIPERESAEGLDALPASLLHAMEDL